MTLRRTLPLSVTFTVGGVDLIPKEMLALRLARSSAPCVVVRHRTLVTATVEGDAASSAFSSNTASSSRRVSNTVSEEVARWVGLIPEEREIVIEKKKAGHFL